MQTTKIRDLCSRLLLGRKADDRCMHSLRSEFVIVYGRRRVGKTFLVENYFNGLFDFTFVGGHRFYLSLLNPSESLVANIDRLFFRKNGELRTEFDELYNAIFSKSEKYLEVVALLNKNKEGLTYSQISKATKLGSQQLTTVLRNLERCDFVLSYIQFGNKVKGTIYRLVDFYTLFYYKFIGQMDSKDEQWWTNNYDSRSVMSWQGVAFELVCLTHLSQIKKALGISGISTSASTWRYVAPKDSAVDKGAQIDLVIDRGDHTINLCEMKFSTGLYTITEDYEEHMRRRVALFREKTRTTKSLVSTFVTTFGVSNGIHRSVVGKEVVAKDLFA